MKLSHEQIRDTLLRHMTDRYYNTLTLDRVVQVIQERTGIKTRATIVRHVRRMGDEGFVELVDQEPYFVRLTLKGAEYLSSRRGAGT